MAEDPKAAFLDSVVWHGSLDAAAAILAEYPGIAGSDIYMAAVLGDDAAVREFLAADPGSATAKGGPRGWDALTYLCFSKYLRLDRSRSEAFVRAATALLDAGASANTGFFDPNHKPAATLESVLYGAAGVAHHPEMTRLLLERGADPNDGEVAYHAPETLDNRAMKVLVESGKLTPESMMWLLVRKFNWQDDQAVAWLLDHGADANYQASWGHRPVHQALANSVPFSYFELLLDHGCDPTLPGKGGVSAFALAARMARGDVLGLFERRGFAAVLQGEDAFLAACARGDGETAQRIAAEDPGLVARLQAQNPGLVVDYAGGSPDALRVLLDLGFDPGAARVQPAWMKGETALHEATGRGLLANALLLMERGAPMDAANHRGDTPLEVAIRCLEEQSEWTPNEFTLPIAEALIRAGANIDLVKMTLAAAVCLGRASDVERLAKEATQRDRQVALAAAAYNSKAAAVPLLIGLGADPNAGNEGLNPYAMALHNAVCSGSLETVRALLAAGARADVKDNSYQATPLDWAEHFLGEKRGGSKQDAEIVACLREHAGKV